MRTRIVDQQTISTRKGNVDYTEYVSGGADPTQFERFRFIRRDGARFAIEQFFGSYFLFIGDKRVDLYRTQEYDDAVAFCRKHSLPSFRYIEERLRELSSEAESDPIGSLAMYE